MRNYRVADNIFILYYPDSNIVLWVQWLYSIGTHIVNYQDLKFSFTGLGGKKVMLRGMHAYPPNIVTSKRIEANLRHGDVLWVVECRIMDKKPT